MCKGKGVVTLRATLVHIDDEGCVSAGPDATDTPSKCEDQGEGPRRLRKKVQHMMEKMLSGR